MRKIKSKFQYYTGYYEENPFYGPDDYWYPMLRHGKREDGHITHADALYHLNSDYLKIINISFTDNDIRLVVISLNSSSKWNIRTKANKGSVSFWMEFLRTNNV